MRTASNLAHNILKISKLFFLNIVRKKVKKCHLSDFFYDLYFNLKLLYVTDICKSMTVTYSLFWFLWFLNAKVIIFFMKFCKLFIKFIFEIFWTCVNQLSSYHIEIWFAFNINMINYDFPFYNNFRIFVLNIKSTCIWKKLIS